LAKQELETHGKSSHAGSIIFVMGNERADFAAVSALIATNIDMAGYPAQNDCFATVNKMSVILYNILDNIYFELKSTYSFQA